MLDLISGRFRLSRSQVVLDLAIIAAGFATLAGVAGWFFLLLVILGIYFSLRSTFGDVNAVYYAIATPLLVLLWSASIGGFVQVQMFAVAGGVLFLIVVALQVLGGEFSNAIKANRANNLGHLEWQDWVLILLPSVVTGLALVIGGALTQLRITWAMGGDAQFNTVLARIINESNGASPDVIWVLSLSQVLMAFAMGPARAQIDPALLLIHDVQANAQLWFLVVAASSVVFAVAARIVSRDLRRVLRFVIATAAAAFPYLWFVTGYAIWAGFYNASTTLLVLAVTWLATLATTRQSRLALHGFNVTLSLGAWTPIVVVPVMLLAWEIISAFIVKKRWPSIGPVALASLIQAGLFFTAFVLPRALNHGSVLNNNGTIVGITFDTLVIAVCLGLIATLTFVAVKSPESWSPTLILVAMVSGVAVLLWVNRSLPNPWIYYPIKFAWFAVALALVFLVVYGSNALWRRAKGRFASSVATALVGVVALGIAFQTPPMQAGKLAYLPFLMVAKNEAPHDNTILELSKVAGSRTIFLEYSEDPLDDLFMNQWLFQLTVILETDQPRGYAYRVVDTPELVCEAAEAWGGDVTVVTASPEAAAATMKTCPNTVVVDLRPKQPGA